MSGLAKVLADRGFHVSGSRYHETELTKMLEQHELRSILRWSKERE